MQKFVARLLIIFMLAPSLVQAVLPAAMIGAVGYFSMATGGGSVALTAPIYGSALTIGAIIAGLSLGGAFDQPSPSAPITVIIDKDAPLPTPTGWTAPVAPSREPKAPPTQTYTIPEGVTVTSGQPWDCGTWTAQGRTLGGTVYAYSTTLYQCPLYDPGLDSPLAGQGWNRGGNWNGYTSWSKAIPQCGTGYSLSSGQCVATPGAVTKPVDNNCTIVRAFDVMAVDPKDPDCLSAPAGLSISESASRVTLTTAPTQTQSVKINADGTVTITTTTVNTGSDGKSTTKTDTVTLGAGTGSGTVKVTGKGSTIQDGAGTQVGGAIAPSDLNLPTDYAREATLATTNSKLTDIKAGQCGGTGQPACKIDETGTPTDASLSAVTTAYNTAATARQGVIEGVASSAVTALGFGLSIPWPSSGCSNFTFALPHIGTFAPDMCARHSDVQAVLNWLVLMGAALTIFMIGIHAIGGRK